MSEGDDAAAHARTTDHAVCRSNNDILVRLLSYTSNFVIPTPPDDVLTSGLGEAAVTRRKPLAGSIEQQIIELFRSKHSLRSIAAKLGINRTVVRRVLTQYGYELPVEKPKLADARLAEIKRLYDSGLPVAGVAARVGVSKNTMLRYMHENSVELRSRGRRKVA